MPPPADTSTAGNLHDFRIQVYNWNVQIVAESDKEQFLTHLDSVPWDVFLFQEWQQHTKFDRKILKRGHLLITNDSAVGHGWGSAILIHQRWASSLISAAPGFRCVSAVVNFRSVEVCLISAHLPACACEAMSYHEMWHNCADSIYMLGHKSKNVVVGMDANTELRPNIPDVTGAAVVGHLYPESQQLLEMMYGLRLRVPSTYEHRELNDCLRHWHQGLLSRQIDFLAVSWPLQVLATSRVICLNYISDHACEHVDLVLETPFLPEARRKRKRVNATWSCADEENFRATLSGLIPGQCTAEAIADIITQAAEIHGKRLNRRQHLDATINTLREAKKQSTDERIRRVLSRQIWALQKHNKHVRLGEKLDECIHKRVGWGKKQHEMGKPLKDLAFLTDASGSVQTVPESILEFEKLYPDFYTEKTPL